MKHIGIVAEYNPFHNGHSYQLEQIKKKFPNKHIIIMLSGDYVQRGEPAIFSKYIRAACALYAGASIVFELPSRFSTGSAEYYASYAIKSLAATGIIDTLCFGAEDADLPIFEQIARLLISEPENYKQLLKQELQRGLSYPAARSIAVAHCLKDDSLSSFMNSPNNILGIEYLKAILRNQYSIQPYIIKRTGSGYHDTHIDTPLASATAIRQQLKENAQSSLVNHMPQAVYQYLQQEPFAKPLFLSDFTPFYQYALWNCSNVDKYAEMSTELANRLNNIAPYPTDINALIEQLSSRNITTSRIKRALLNIVLQHTKEEFLQQNEASEIPYLRILGLRKDASFLLKEMKACCNIPVINKVADAKLQLSGAALSQFQQELHNNELYHQAFYNKYQLPCPSEYQHSVILI